MWRILVLPGIGQVHWQCSCLSPSYQDIPLCHHLANNLQGLLILGAFIWLYVLFLSLFLLCNSKKILTTMWRHGEGGKEEIECVIVMQLSRRAPGWEQPWILVWLIFCGLGQLILRPEVQEVLVASSVRERFRSDNFCVPSCFQTPVTFFHMLQHSQA